MEKYYISRLFESSAYQPDLDRKSRFIEVKYAQKPPSFGTIHLLQDEHQIANQLTGQAHKSATGTQLCLATLDLTGRDDAHYKVVRLVELDDRRSRVVDFDSSYSVMLDDYVAGNSRNFQCHCIAIYRDGGLLAVDLATGGSQILTGNLQDASRSNFIGCKLQPAQDESETDCQYIHTLSHQAYCLYRLEGTRLKLEHSYSTPREDDFTEARLIIVELQPNTVLIQLEDSSVKVLHKSRCIATLDASPASHYLTLAKLSNVNETIILRYSKSHLTAYKLNINERGDDRVDPDRLLVREPTFDLEQRWTFDLADIDCLGLISDDDNYKLGCLCPVYSSHQLSPDNCLPKFLIVTYKYHILVYSFEQKPSLPFTVVYDNLFNQSPQLKATIQGEIGEETVDLEQTPKLIHNFKLIGTNPSDALFNTIFLAREANLVHCQHFRQLGLLLGLTSSSDILAFKFRSERIVQDKDSVHQQQVSSSIVHGAFLNDQIERTKINNTSLREDIARLENRSLDAKRIIGSLDTIIRVEVKPRKDTASLYDLNIFITSLIQVSKIIVTSTARSYFLKPDGSAIQEYCIDNETRQTSNEAFVVDNVDLQTPIEEILKTTSAGNREDPQDIQTSLVISLNTIHQLRQQPMLNLPIYIVDGQTSQLKFFFVLNPCTFVHSEEPTNYRRSLADESKFHLKIVPIKPLMSYCNVPDRSLPEGESAVILKISGSVGAEIFLTWLNECYDADGFVGAMESLFTGCLLRYKVENTKIELESQDIMALELIKKHLLKRATDQSIGLEVMQSGSDDPSIFSCLIEKQCRNLEKFLLTINRKLSSSDSLKFDNKDQEELLFETLLNEMLSIDLPEGLSLDSVEKSLRSDIKSSLNVVNSSADTDDYQSEEADILRELVCGHIIDLLVDYDRLQGFKEAPMEVMLLMRSELNSIMQTSGGISGGKRGAISDLILMKWRSIRQVAPG